MQVAALKLHPDSICSAVTAIDVAVMRRAADLVFLYSVTGDMACMRRPPVTAPARSDQLWQHTCFEAFVRPSPGGTYYEFNFAPSTQWAAYRFESYRSGVRLAEDIGAARIYANASDADCTLYAAIQWPSPAGAVACQLGLAAVIEETSGRKSYWALAHPPGKPDFHHADCFALEFS